MRSTRRISKGGVQVEKQQRYVRLIAAGVNNSEACRLVGINRKTGNRWRYGRSVRNSAGEPVHYASVRIIEPRVRSPRYLSEAERLQIADLLRAGQGVREIGRQLGRAASTVSREIRRNRDPDGRYRPHHAEQLARVARTSRGRDGSRSTRSSARRSRGCWPSAGVLSRLRTSCVSGSSASVAAGFAPKRSTRRSMTRRRS